MRIRPAAAGDAARIAEIYNAGMAGRQATFETEERSAADFADRLDGVLVAEEDGTVVGWATVSGYSDRCVYSGVGEYTIYLDPAVHGRGLGRRLLTALVEQAERDGLYKLIGKVFTTNAPSIAIAERCGFTVVGTHRRHGRLDGEWKDVVVLERLLGEAAGTSA
jgi:L-amino acid N-acyltransferase YncA